jgi:chemotaxis signal transduction protein
VAAPDSSVLLFRVGDVSCAIPCAHVVETMRRPPVTPLDGMPAFTLGMATIRGNATPVVDAAALLGWPTGPAQRLVTVRAGDQVVALAVDDVIGVSFMDPAQLAARPRLLTESPAGIVRALATKDGALHLVLDTARVVESAHPGGS